MMQRAVNIIQAYSLRHRMTDLISEKDFSHWLNLASEMEAVGIPRSLESL